MSNQRTLRFSVNRQAGELAVNHRLGEQILNSPFNIEHLKTPRENVAQCLKSSMLKRLARRAMADVTDCPPETIGAHIARIEDLLAVFGHNLRHDFKETGEATLGATPLKPYTLAEYHYCLSWTREHHRASAFVNQRDEDISQIKNMISTLAGLIAQNPEALELFQRQFDKAQAESEAA